MNVLRNFAIALACFLVSASARAAYPEYVCGVYDGTYIYNIAGSYSKDAIVAHSIRFCKTWSKSPSKCDSAKRVVCQLVSPSPTKPVAFKFLGAVDARTGQQVHELRRSVYVPSGSDGSGAAGGGTASLSPDTQGRPNENGGECTPFAGCTFPNSCQNGWCVAPGGGGGECTPFAGCTFPNSCQNGWCVAPGGGGGECTPFAGCTFPNSCQNGWCVAP